MARNLLDDYMNQPKRQGNKNLLDEYIKMSTPKLDTTAYTNMLNTLLNSSAVTGNGYQTPVVMASAANTARKAQQIAEKYGIGDSSYRQYLDSVASGVQGKQQFMSQFTGKQDYNERYAYPQTVKGKTDAEIEAMMGAVPKAQNLLNRAAAFGKGTGSSGDDAYQKWLTDYFNNQTVTGLDRQIADNQGLLDANKAKQEEIKNRVYTGQSTPEINAARVARDYWANMAPSGQMIRADRADQVKYDTQQQLYNVYTAAMTGAPMSEEERKLFDAYVANSPEWQKYQASIDANKAVQEQYQQTKDSIGETMMLLNVQKKMTYADFVNMLSESNSPLIARVNAANQAMQDAEGAIAGFDAEYDEFRAGLDEVEETGDTSKLYADLDYADRNKAAYDQLVAGKKTAKEEFDAANKAVEEAYREYIASAENQYDSSWLEYLNAYNMIDSMKGYQGTLENEQYAAAMPNKPESVGKTRAEQLEETIRQQLAMAEGRLDNLLSTAAGDWEAKNSQELYNLTSEQEKLDAQIEELNRKRTSVQYAKLMENPDYSAKSAYNADIEDPVYQWINKNGTSQIPMDNQIQIVAGEAVMSNAFSDLDSQFSGFGWTFLHPDEVGMYNYLYETQGNGAAMQWLNSLGEEPLKRKRMAEAGELQQLANSGVFGAGAVSNILAYGAGTATSIMMPFQMLDAALNPNHSEYSDLYRYNYTKQTLMNEVGKAWNDKFNQVLGGKDGKAPQIFGKEMGESVYGALMSIADFMGASKLGKAAGAASGSAKVAKNLSQWLMSSKVASDYLLQGTSRGLGVPQTIGTAIAAGVIEALTEKYSLDAIWADPDGAVKYITKNLITEGLEEGASNIANTVVDLIVNGDKAELAQAAATAEGGLQEALMNALQDLGMDVLMGAFSGSLVGGGKVAATSYAQNVATKQTGKQINTNQTYKQLHDIAVAMPEGSKARKIAQGNDKLNNRKAGQLYNALMEELGAKSQTSVRKSMVTDIKGRLQELGAQGDTTQVAEAIQKAWMGEKLSARESDLIAQNKLAMQVQHELLDLEEGWAEKAQETASKQRRETLTQMLDVERLASKGYKPAQDDAAAKAISKNASTTYANADQEKGLNTTAYTKEGTTVEIKRIEEQDGQAVYLVEKDGQDVTYAINDLELDSINTENLVQPLKRGKMSVQAANTMMQFYATSGLSAPLYAKGFMVAYNAGVQRIGMAYVNNNSYSKALSPEVRKAAFDAGMVDTKDEAPSVTKRKGRVTVDKSIDKANLTDNQKASIRAMEKLAKALHIDIEFFASKADATGSYAAYENGSFRDGVMRLDINAGRDKSTDVTEFAILRTASHELTHYIAEASPQMYRELQSFVVDHLLEKGQSLQTLMDRKKARENRAMSDEAALEEVIADACEMMLKDSTAIETLARENATLFEKMADWLRDFFDKIREAFAGVEAVHAEARALMEADADGVMRYIDGLQALWDKALVDAARNVQGAELSDDNIKTVEKFAMREPVEQKRNLIAVHNLTEDNLLNALNLGGLPMPSLAIVKAETGHEKYGPISLLFGKETIDPATNKENKVYGADAWTPTAPNVEYKVNEKADEKVGKKISELSAKIANGVFAFKRYSVTNNEDAISDNADALAEKLARNPKVKAAYAAEMGIEIPVEMKKKVFSRHGNDALREFIDAVGSKERLMDLVVEAEDNGYVPEAEARIISGIIEKIVRKDLAKFEGKRPADVIEKRVQDRLEKLTQRYELVRFLEDAYKMQADPNVTSDEVDYFATEDNLQEAVDNKDVVEWLKPMLVDVVGEAGIRNKLDWYTPSGNRRSFKALHDPYTLENIVKAMKGNQHARGQNAHSSATGIGSITSKEYKNIKEIKEDSGRLGAVTEEEYKRATMAIDRRIGELWGKIVNSGASVSRYDDELLVDIARDVTRGQMTAAKIAKSFKNIASVTVSNEIAEEALAIFKDAAELPTEYFEAKPARVVNFDEIRLAVLPDNVRHDLYKRLEDAGVPVETYEAGNEQQRLELLNSRPDTKFSTRDVAYSQAIDVRARFRASYNRHPVGLWFRNEALMGALDEGYDEKPNELELMIQQLQPRVLAGDDVSMVYASNEDGETKIAIIEKVGKMEYDIVDVYRLDTTRYGGRVSELIDKFEQGVKHYGRQEYDGWIESFGESYAGAYVGKYDHRNRKFDENRPDARGEGREDAGVAGTQRDGRRVAGGGTKSPWGLKSDLPVSVRSLWPEYKQRIKDGDYFPKNVKPGQYSFVVLYDYLLVQKMQSDGRFVVEAVYEENDLAERDVYAIGRVFDEVYDNAAERTFDSMAEVQALLDGLKDWYGESFVSRRRNQARDADTISSREALANALETAAKNELERGLLADYKKIIQSLNEDQEKLAGHQKIIRELSFKKGGLSQQEKDELAMAKNRAEIVRNRLNRNDKKLLKLEATEALKAVVARERVVAERKIREEKDKQLAEYRERTRDTLTRSALRDRIRHDVKALNRLLLNETDTKHVPEELKGAVAQFLTVFTQDTSVFDQKKLDDLRYAYGKISDRNAANEDLPDISAQYDWDIANMMDELREILPGKRLSELTQEETRKIRDIVQHFKFIVKESSRLFFYDKSQNVAKAGQKFIEDTDQQKKYNGPDGAVANMLRGGMITPSYFFKKLGGVAKELFDDLKQGESTYGLRVAQARKFFDDVAEKYHYDDWRNVKDDVLTLKTQQGHEVVLTREQALGLYATWNRENSENGQNASHLSEGGFVYEEAMKKDKKTGKIEVDTSKPHKMTDKDMQQVANWLTDEQRAYADAMVDYMSKDMAKLGNEVSMKLFGIEKYGEEKYYPYQTSKNYRYTALGAAAATNDQRLKHSSFTHRVTQFANNPIIAADFTTVWANHVNHMLLYSSMCVPLENFNRVYNYKYTDEDGNHSVKQSLINAYGSSAQKYIEQLMHDLNGGVAVQSDGVMDQLTSKFKKNAVYASASVVVQQPSAMVRAMALVNPKYFASGVMKDGSWDELTQYSGVAVIKEMGGFDTSTGFGAQDWITGERRKTKLETFSKKADDIASLMPERADRLAWVAIWKAVKAEVADNTGLEGEELLQAAAKRFDEVIGYTQVYDSTLSKSQMMRNKHLNAVTAFMAEPTVTYNLLVDAFFNRGKADSVNPARAVAAFTATAIVNAMLKSLVTAARDDEEKNYLEKYAGEFVENVTSDLNPLNLIPYARDIVSIMQGYDVERADMSLISDLYKGVKRGVESAKDGDWYTMAKEFAGPISGLVGLPVKNVWRDIEAVFNTIHSIGTPMTPGGMKYSILEALPFYGSTPTDYYIRRLDAMLEGDASELESLTMHLETGLGKAEKTVKSKTKEELGKRYKAGKIGDEEATDILMDYFEMDADEAYWQLKEWREKEAHKDEDDYSFSRTDDLKEALLSGKTAQIEVAKTELAGVGGYTDKEVVSKAKSAIKSLYVDGQITLDKAMKLLQDQAGDMTQDDLYWTEQEWAYEKANPDGEWNKFMGAHAAIESGKGAKQAAKELLTHGVEKGDAARAIATRWKATYVSLYNTDRKAALDLHSRILDMYVALGYSRSYQIKYIKDHWFE